MWGIYKRDKNKVYGNQEPCAVMVAMASGKKTAKAYAEQQTAETGEKHWCHKLSNRKQGGKEDGTQDTSTD